MAFILVSSAAFVRVRLFLPFPQTPWEAGIATDAWRMMHGGSVYATGTNHATHMYGPLVTVVLSEAFRFTGPELLAGRLFSVVAAILILLLLARIFGRGDPLLFGVVIALLLAANSRTHVYFTETRPDLESALFGVLALVFLYRGLETDARAPRLGLVVAGSALLAVAVLFKQTAAVLMFIPALTLLGRERGSHLFRLAVAAAIPVAGVAIVFGGVRILAPGLWHFMVEVPAQYRVPVARAGGTALEFLTSIPLFALALVHWLFTDAAATWRMPRARWLTAALILTIPVSILAAAKDGGAANSLIPALLSVGAFCAWRAPAALAGLRDAGRPLPARAIAGSVFGILLFLHVYPNAGTLSYGGLKKGHGVGERDSVIAEARSLPGRVVSPDDPEIAVLAKGYAGRTGVFEADAVYWDPRRTQALADELRSADYVIAMRQAVLADGNALQTDNLGWGVDDATLTASGFSRTQFRTVSTPVYELWRRARP